MPIDFEKQHGLYISVAALCLNPCKAGLSPPYNSLVDAQGGLKPTRFSLTRIAQTWSLAGVLSPECQRRHS